VLFVSFWTFISSLFGGRTHAAERTPVAQSPKRPQPQAIPATRQAQAEFMVHREELIDARMRIAGYRFSTSPTGAPSADPAQASIAALLADGAMRIAERRLALITLTGQHWQRAELRPLIGPHTLFLPSPAAGDDPAVWKATLDNITAASGQFALSAELASRLPEAAQRAHLILIDFRQQSLESFEQRVGQCRQSHPEALLAAAGVCTWSEHRVVQGLGVQYSLGDFATTPDDAIQAEALSQSRQVLVEMLNLLRRGAELSELATLAKRDPGVVLKIVEMANSPLSGLSSPVANFDQALMVIGREMLYRWLTFGIYRQDAAERDEMLLEIALRRARFLELIAQGERSKQQCDELFLVGMFSVFDSLLGLSMERVLEKIHLPAAVGDVLARSEGPYAGYLTLTLAVEKGRSELVGKMTRQLGLPLQKVADSSAAALAWAEAALKSS
jgi:EAL and modified HD-GYP domain-containing signal transduction protein